MPKVLMSGYLNLLTSVSTPLLVRFWILLFIVGIMTRAQESAVPVAFQPLRANVERVRQALELAGAPLAPSVWSELEEASKNEDASRLQTILDKQVLCVVEINPE